MILSIFTGNVLATSRLLSTRSHPRALQTDVTRTGLPSNCHIFPKTFNSRFGRSRGSFSRFSAEIYLDTDYCSILRTRLLNQELRFGKRFEEVTPKRPCHGEQINSKNFKLLIYWYYSKDDRSKVHSLSLFNGHFLQMVAPLISCSCQ